MGCWVSLLCQRKSDFCWQLPNAIEYILLTDCIFASWLYVLSVAQLYNCCILLLIYVLYTHVLYGCRWVSLTICATKLSSYHTGRFVVTEGDESCQLDYLLRIWWRRARRCNTDLVSVSVNCVYPNKRVNQCVYIHSLYVRMCYIPGCIAAAPHTESYHNANFAVTGGAAGCRDDSLWYRQFGKASNEKVGIMTTIGFQ